jgi:S1-C subfamily serine protease
VTGSVGGLSLEILTGSLAGRRLDFEPGKVHVGRAADAHLRFDPEVDLEVSGRHAELRFDGGGWIVQDLGSTNGTWLNGEEVSGSRPLAEGDEIWFGQVGPRVRVLRSGRVPGPLSGPAPGGMRASAGPAALEARGPVAMIAWAVGAALLVVAVFVMVQRSGRGDWEAERDLLTARVDSLLARESTLSAQVEATRQQAADSVAEARAEIERLRERLQAVSAQSEDGEVDELRRELQEAMVLLEQQQLAAALDVEEIRRRVEPAVAMIWSEWSDGRVATGTAVSVDGGGTLLTSRHVVAPDDVGEGDRVAVQFAGSAQVWRADLIETHPQVDLAWVQPEGIVGEVPSLDGINLRVDTLPAGSPVAIVGFPLGGRARSAADGSRPRAVVSSGILLGSDDRELRVRGYGAEGASGSPVVARDGRMIGVVYGGTEEAGSRILLAVPIRYFTEFQR